MRGKVTDGNQYSGVARLKIRTDGIFYLIFLRAEGAEGAEGSIVMF